MSARRMRVGSRGIDRECELAGASSAAPVGRRAQTADRPRTASIAIPPASEPGVTLTVEGRVLLKGGAPAGGVDVYVYHTDARGHYSPDGRDERNPRLKGYLRTDDQGRYQVRTIRPGPYPNSGPPAHIHYEVTSPSGVQRFELVFEGDARTDRRHPSRGGGARRIHALHTRNRSQPARRRVAAPTSI